MEMGRRVVYRGIITLLGVVLPVTAAMCAPSSPEYPETRQLVRFVSTAGSMVTNKGEDAFPAFRARASEWFRGDSYIFVSGVDGVMLCHPAQPELEGRNLLDLKDVNGKPFVRAMVRAASGSSRSGWVHYMWPKPGQKEPSWKSAYVVRVTAPSNKEYLVGSGVYPTRTEKMFAVTAVEDAAALIRRDREAAFKTLRDKAGDFIFGDLYVFVLDTSGKALVHPAQPSLEGQNLLDLKDSSGKAFVREMVRTLESQESGWVDYLWPKPGQTTAVQKSTYLRKVNAGGSSLIVGAGVYVDTK
jgi:signal transduction histidine kinase